MKGEAHFPYAVKKHPGDAFIGLRQVRGIFPYHDFGTYRFFKVNHINYNYYDHHSLSVSRLYRRVM